MIKKKISNNHIPIPKSICTYHNFQFGCLSWYSPSQDSYRRLTPEPASNFVLTLGIFTTAVAKKINNNNKIICHI